MFAENNVRFSHSRKLVLSVIVDIYQSNLLLFVHGLHSDVSELWKL
jgi:hypothetical protein